MDIALVAARSQNNVIGKGLEIPWRVKGEQKLFKQITMGGSLIMGRRTFDSIGRPLPGRETIIVTRNTEFSHEGCHVCHNLDQATELAQTLSKPIFVVGGGDIYKQMLSSAQEIHLTTIEAEVEGDIYFPEFDPQDYYLAEEQHFESNVNYTYQKLVRIP